MTSAPCDKCDAKKMCNFISASHCMKLIEWQNSKETPKGLYTTEYNDELCKKKEIKHE